jgi:hypothetical protein
LVKLKIGRAQGRSITIGRSRVAAVAGAFAAAGVLLVASARSLADAPAAPAAAEIDAGGPAEGCAKDSENEGFFSRLEDCYKSHLAWNSGEVPESNPLLCLGRAQLSEISDRAAGNCHTAHGLFNDARGQRIGFKIRFYEFSFGQTHWMGDTIELRPMRFSISDHECSAANST